MQPFTLSIETTEGVSHQHGFHLGTYEILARAMIEEMFKSRVVNGLPVVTMALMREGKIVDVYYGNGWNSNLGDTQ